MTEFKFMGELICTLFIILLLASVNVSEHLGKM